MKLSNRQYNMGINGNKCTACLFFQLLHQGTKFIPIDFIGFVKSLHKEDNQQDKLISNLFGQAETLMLGKSKSQVIRELEKKGLSKKEILKLAPFKFLMEIDLQIL